MDPRLAILTRRESELSRLLERYFPGPVQRIDPREAACRSLKHYSAIAVLGGTDAAPLVLEAATRNALEDQIAAGTQVFCEYVQSVGAVYAGEPVSTRFQRLVCARDCIAGIALGELLEDQCNQFLSPYFSRQTGAPILCYSTAAQAHRRMELPPEAAGDVRQRALWEEQPNLLLAAFRLCNPTKARFSPFPLWDALFLWLLRRLGCEPPTGFVLERPYRLSGQSGPLEEPLCAAVMGAVRWFDAAGILRSNGTRGVSEGFGTEIDPEGRQKRAESVRTDCCGEASLLFLADYLLTGNPASLEKSDNLERFCFEQMQIKSGEFQGMLRWTDIAWEVCYGDDAARALLPSLLKTSLLGKREFLPDCCAALDFLQRTTGTDGLRLARTDLLVLDAAEQERLRTQPGAFSSAHYNAFYSAALVLAGVLTGRADFLKTGIQGLESLMAVYPHTVREQSETEELCRLIFPLSCLYWATGEARHREWLERVINDLQGMRHPSGGYLEWDSDYSAACSKQTGGECSLLTKNGEPVVDLLYSNNWLPLGFLAAWQATGDPRYRALWGDVCRFLAGIQLHSETPDIDGAWARGFDVELGEVFGLPNDVGWGPWAIESGWTVAEIAAGMAIGLSGKPLFPPRKGANWRM